jgi:hypothetical protein
MLSRQRGRRRDGDDDVHLAPNQFRRKIGQPLDAALGESIVNNDVLALHPTEFAQPL